MTSLAGSLRDSGLDMLKRLLRGPMARVRAVHRLRWRVTSREALFTQVYESSGWDSAESGSGTGSELRATVDIRERLPELLTRHGVTTMLDAPCGDLNWMRHIDLPVQKYHGVDIVASVIEKNQEEYGNTQRDFAVADLTKGELPKVDLVLCRDCLVHISFQDAADILENFRSTGAKWLVINQYDDVERNHNQFTGRNWRRLNMLLPPFNFPEPLESFPDGGEVDPNRLGLWRLQDLPAVQRSGL
ncbi:class I SAM-dependent methyltransferase [Kribbella sp. NBC_00709]|uniref:class I SAM-dependent methyltransferase n=1 Tax=Kribbella sp. NBC_00709 TaxID=2975972 RepID=UPI002E2E0674|nr:class I SAM-dependent methyltransferase [Kribbella sp. NBC_00709]